MALKECVLGSSVVLAGQSKSPMSCADGVMHKMDARRYAMGVALQRSDNVTQRDVDAFMGKCVVEDSGPLTLRDDVNLILTLESKAESACERMHPFKSHLLNLLLSSTLTEGSLPLVDDVSECSSDSDLDSNIDVADDVSDARHIRCHDIFLVMTELVSAYDLKTCLISIRQQNGEGEQIFLLHDDVFHKMWRTQMYLSSWRFSRLLVLRSIPTIIPDVSKDYRLRDDFSPFGVAAQFFVQVPIGLSDDGEYLGVINLVGRHALIDARLDGFDLLVRKACELASMFVARLKE